MKTLMKPKQLNQEHKDKLKFNLIHQIDSIYQGAVNSSYQKEGFGIQQTIDFQTYFGYWRNNKADGLGLVIYPTGSIIYGKFCKDQLNGVVVTDDRVILRCGVYSNLELIGIGFEYLYQHKTWKMSRYHKGLPIELIKEEENVKQGILPKLMNVEQSLLIHLKNYFAKRFFVDDGINDAYCHQVSPLLQHFGYLDEGGYYGLGVLIEKHQIKEVGFYEFGLLNGYGLQCNYEDSQRSLGFYNKGKKEGLFYQRYKSTQNFRQYIRGKPLNQTSSTMQLIRKRQRKYNYQCKDFLSAKTTLPYHECEQILVSPQIRAYQLRKKIEQDQELQRNNKSYMNIASSTPYKKKTTKQQKSSYFIVQQNKQKSSVQIMKQKMASFMNVLESSPDKSGRQILKPKKIQWEANSSENRIGQKDSINPQKGKLKGKDKQKQSIESADDIAEEQNPFIVNVKQSTIPYKKNR